jgi:predicted outer membrane repeat protein
MQRWFRLSSLLLMLTAAFTVASAQDYVEVRGSLPPGEVRVFVRDTIYRISGTYTIGGTLVIEPGTRVEFLPNGRLIDSTGGRIIADGRASATYNPNAVNALFPPYTGYDDLNYFGAPGVVTSSIATEPTIHPSKYSVVFNVNLGADPNLQGLTPAKAIMYKAARLELGGVISAIRLNPWFRPKFASPINVTPARITFIAGDVNNFSREWGHITVLPGAGAAFFRDVDFLNFRKDTTVDNEPIYWKNAAGQNLTRANAEAANDALLTMTNGGGGAISTFSVRTWIVGCKFTNNMARYRGGALQVLQAPVDNSGNLQLYPSLTQGQLNSLMPYPATTNPYITDPVNAQPIQQTFKAIDYLHLSSVEPLTDSERQSLDDARHAMYLGRIRQIRFVNNRALLADVDTVRIGNVTVVTDAMRPATVRGVQDRSRKNEAHGGAVYINGRNSLWVGLGVNDFQGKDTIEFTGNYAENRQATNVVNNLRTDGAKGGAVYVGGDSTNIIFAGRYTSNKTTTPYITQVSTADPNTSVATYSHGGAIYTNSRTGQVHVRGGLDNNPATHFTSNTSARGGAIYVAASTTSTSPAPIIGGSDGVIVARNYGFNIKFRDNRAVADGGAVYTARNMQVYGAGGASGPLWIYGTNYGVEFANNIAGYSGGAVSVNLASGLPVERRVLRFVRAHFLNNSVGNVADSVKNVIRGGGALYTINSDLNVVKGVEFRNNRAWYSNGGAIAVVSPEAVNKKRFFVTDLDQMIYDGTGVAIGYTPRNDVFTFQTSTPSADERMLTRFYENVATPNGNRQGNGTTQAGNPGNLQHPGTTLRENGTGLGGALYVLDSIRVRVDTMWFDRVRLQNNTAYTGAAIYSDNYDLKIALQRCLVTGNTANSIIGRSQDVIDGPLLNNNNPASSDLAGAVLYGEITGPLPWRSYSFAANSIYDNNARFIIRLPDAQDTKGVLAGSTGLGFGGVDTLRGNYWGRTEANVNTILPISGNQSFQRIQESFFIAGNGKTHMRFIRTGSLNNTTEQGPFESTWYWTYKPVPIGTIPDTLLAEGRIYDIFDKGTDIKTADYSARRMSPIEDFAVGIPSRLSTFTQVGMPSFGKDIKRWTRNPQDAEMYPYIAKVQTEFSGNHPIGYPLFLEARADYSQTAEISNNDARAFNETVFFVINERTGDYVRANLKQKGLTDTIYRGRIDLVPDSSNGTDPNIRRSYEGLATYGTGASLLSRLADDAIAEDSSALPGRRWEGSTALGELGGQGFRLGNRPGLPTSNGGKETYYGGERYRALPVINGDRVTIISRTTLWRDGVNAAIDRGLSFTVDNSTQPPVFTGSADTLADASSLIPEMRNRVFVTENRLYTPITSANSPKRPNGAAWFNEPASYPADPITLQPNTALDWTERDSIFTITAIDANKFYDPRVMMDSTKGSYLSYYWDIETPNSGLQYWLRDTLVDASDADSLAWGSIGYRMLRGRPINPYVVPGGEDIEVVAKNFPPSLEIVDTLRASGFTEDVISKWLYLYPSYFHAEEYDNNALPLDQRTVDNTNARFLQQDTVNYGWNDTSSYRFKIHVVDSMPRFVWAHNTTPGQPFTNFLRGDVTIVLDPTTTDAGSYDNATGTYLDTLRYTVTRSRVARFLEAPNAILRERYNAPVISQPDTINVQYVANVTDSLRFMLDVNTDDEFEDAAAVDANRAVVQKYGAWDFRYGKTSYGFLSTTIAQNPGDTTLDEVMVTRPSWMAPQYMRTWDNGAADPFAEDFTSKGQLNIRVDRATAEALLRPYNQVSGDMNTDTLMTVVANDGHGGINYYTRNVFVNMQPKITTAALPDAFEDVDYNVALLDSSRRITVYDPNFGQAHDFELIYIDENRTEIAVDPYFPEAGSIALDASKKTTPKWLKIDRVSGLLYGTPRVTDLPNADTTVLVTILVTDKGGLNDIVTVPLRINFRNHDPKLFSSPLVKCIEIGKPYSDTIKVTDIDLARKQAANEELTFVVLEPTGSWTFTPEKLSSPIADTQTVVLSNPAFNATPVNGRVTIKIVVTDKEGAKDTLVYSVAVSAETRFTSTIRVENNLGAWQDMSWGVGRNEIATRGDEDGAYGKLDSNYCEFELPPVPYIDVFDARWTIPNRNGTLRNIFPFANEAGEAIYRARFQPGGETGQSSFYYPVRISWNRDEIPAVSADFPGSFYIRDDISNGALFNFNMKTGEGRSAADILHKVSGSTDTLVISRTSLQGFIIVYDFTTDVNDEILPGAELSINGAMPNPFTESTMIAFNVPTTAVVTVEVFDAIGTKVATLARSTFDAGRHVIEWNGTADGVAAGSGLYTVRVSNGSSSATHQIVLVR